MSELRGIWETWVTLVVTLVVTEVCSLCVRCQGTPADRHRGHVTNQKSFIRLDWATVRRHSADLTIKNIIIIGCNNFLHGDICMFCSSRLAK